MGWGDCGEDSKGRPIGYVHEATCDHPGCDKKIDRGLSYACGDMHGETEYGCEKYFCSEHRENIVEDEGDFNHICDGCKKELIDSGEWVEHPEEGTIIRKPDDWRVHWFTYGSNHVDKDGNSLGERFTKIEGTFDSTRKAMFQARGSKWSIQYGCEAALHLDQFPLTEISLEDATLPKEQNQDG